MTFRESDDVTESELQQIPEVRVLIRLEMRPEPFPSGLLMSVLGMSAKLSYSVFSSYR